MTAAALVIEAEIERALCRGVDPELWYALVGSDDDRCARQLCRACPLRRPCAQVALDRGDRFGVWGGLDGEQRAAYLAVPIGERPPLAAFLRHADRTPLRRNGPGRPATRPCGTAAAHARHIRRGEQPCEPCRVAHNAEAAASVRRRRDRKKASA